MCMCVLVRAHAYVWWVYKPLLAPPTSPAPMVVPAVNLAAAAVIITPLF